MTRHLAAWLVRVQIACLLCWPVTCMLPLQVIACLLPCLQPFLALLPLPAPLRQGGTACKCISGLELLACPSDAQCCPAHHMEAPLPCS